MNYKCLTGIFATLFAISLTVNVYQSRESTPIDSRRAYEKKILESEEKVKKNRELFRKLEKRVEDIERKSSANYFTKPDEYDFQRFL